MEPIVFLIIYLISIPFPAVIGWQEINKVRKTKIYKGIHDLFDRPATKWDLAWNVIFFTGLTIVPIANSAITVTASVVLFFEWLWKTKFIKWMKSPL